MKSVLCLTAVLVFLGASECRPSTDGSKPVLKGITQHMEPYVYPASEAKEGKAPLQGFLIDLFAAITNESSFEHTLDMSKVVHYRELVKQVENKTYDFALADLTVTEERKNAVDFTEPFINISMAAAVRKDDFAAHKTLKEVVEATHANPDIKYGVMANSNTAKYFKLSTHPLAMKIWKKIEADEAASLVPSMREGFNKVLAGNYIFFSESPTIEYLSKVKCTLKALPDSDHSLTDYNRVQAIAMQKGMDKELKEMNSVIKRMTTDGSLAKLYDKYWNENVKCRKP